LALLLLLFGATPAFSIDANQPVHHQLQVEIQPDQGRLTATDHISLPSAQREVEFLLHADLTPLLVDRDAHLASMERLEGPVPLRRYRIQASIPRKSFSVAYHGIIRHPLTSGGERGSPLQSTPGLISTDGVFLAGNSYWYPQIGHSMVSFQLQIQLPERWRSVSQGSPLAGHNGWQELQPQEEIYLIAYPYHYYQQPGPGPLAEVYLRQPDPALAERYLQATGRYLSLYEKLLGPYPYGKFALVENFWESGYGMPSFTLLGPRVIQLPFIIHTSYPHEVLHNWWGNGVYVDPASGNWSEGLTTYLADHLLKEQQGDGAAYRRTTLQNYSHYVASQDDFPLSRFRGNHGQISQSVGYGKTLMLFHMLRMELGDQLFLQGLRQFYRDYRFRMAGFDALRDTFEAVTGKKLGDFFDQWLTRTGAPILKLVSAESTLTGEDYRLRIQIEQTQPDEPYRLKVPLFVHFADTEQAVPYHLEMNGRDATLEIISATRPLKVSVDPLFDLFRRLDPSETPSSLGQLFGAKRLYAVIPDAADEELQQAYTQLLRGWQQRQPGLTLLRDSAIERLPETGPIWILDKDNRFSRLFDQRRDELELSGKPGTFALTLAQQQAPGQTLGYITTDNAAALTGLARKLPHYGRYSYALFIGDEPAIGQRGEWRIADSSLSVQLPAISATPYPEIPDHRPLTETGQ
jgi:hypothetical protein